MKSIIELTRAIANDDFYENQFMQSQEGKNILFLTAQLSGKQLYKTLLPYFCLYNKDFNTALLDIHRYDPVQQLHDIQVHLEPEHVIWADYIVIPFTTQRLASMDEEQSIYAHLKQVNPDVKIVFCIDFNYYEVSDKHPYAPIFKNTATIDSIEHNIWLADICMVSNLEFRNYLLKKLKGLAESKFKGIGTKVMMACMPFIIDTEIVSQNVEYDPQEPTYVGTTKEVEHPPEIEERIEQVEKANSEGKEKTLTKRKPRTKKTETKKTASNGTPKRSATKRKSTKSTTKSTGRKRNSKSTSSTKSTGRKRSGKSNTSKKSSGGKRTAAEKS